MYVQLTLLSSGFIITVRHNTLLTIITSIPRPHNNNPLPAISLPCAPPRSLPLAPHWLQPGSPSALGSSMTDRSRHRNRHRLIVLTMSIEFYEQLQ